MHLRLLSNRLVRCLRRSQSSESGERSFDRYMCTVQYNLKPLTSNFAAVYHQQYRFRRRGMKNVWSAQEENDSDDDEEVNSHSQESNYKEEVEPGAKIVIYKLDSPRTDRLLRKALNISGKKVEDLFYSKKVRVNGEVLLKKGQQVGKGALITIALEETSGKTARGALIEVLEIIEHESNYSVRVSRNRNTFVDL